MGKLQAILATVLLAGLLAGCIVVDRPYHGGYYWHYDRDRW
ncbi:MAG TPA: hypothetical protein VN821_03110 [Candidatus Udaeobacter sp.]|jgi:hypothetical protein|nr:hypothetical protein [Candidatus Udaeobacter sp.]